MEEFFKKIQVSLTLKEYEILEEIASQQKKKMGILAHEAIEEYYLKKKRDPEIAKTVDRSLFAPEDYQRWEGLSP